MKRCKRFANASTSVMPWRYDEEMPTTRFGVLRWV